MEECMGEETQEGQWNPELLTLREALASANGAITPDGLCYVRYNEDNHVTMDRPWEYIPDTQSWALVWLLQDSQLERLVLFSQQRQWVSASNVIFEW